MDKQYLDKFIEELDDKLELYEGLTGDKYKESLREQYNLAKRFYNVLPKPDGVHDSKLFEDIAMDMDADVMGWIVELPFALLDHGGMVDEAIEICNLFAEVFSPDNFFGDQEDRQERALPLRKRQEIQEMLRQIAGSNKKRAYRKSHTPIISSSELMTTGWN